MLSQIATSVLFLATLATAHFGLEYPEWRGDSFATGASQYVYPCANVNQTASTNRTAWPLRGGSIVLDLHHPWSYIMINLGLGTDYPVFNISLTQNFLNSTGNGTLCLPQLVLPSRIQPVEGQNASIQVVTFGATGSALYNCADITFTSKATALSGSNCSTSAGVTFSAVNQEFNGSTTAANSTTTAVNSTTTKASAGASLQGSSVAATALVIGLAAVGMGWLL